jgi:hypothetical protein
VCKPRSFLPSLSACHLTFSCLICFHSPGWQIYPSPGSFSHSSPSWSNLSGELIPLLVHLSCDLRDAHLIFLVVSFSEALHPSTSPSLPINTSHPVQTLSGLAVNMSSGSLAAELPPAIENTFTTAFASTSLTPFQSLSSPRVCALRSSRPFHSFLGNNQLLLLFNSYISLSAVYSRALMYV